MKKSTNRKTTKIIAFMIIGLVIVTALILVLEVIFRFNPQYGRVGFEFDRNLIYRLNDNLEAQNQYASGKVGKDPFTLRFNNKGFRGPDFEKRKKEGLIRVMILGDSYTAGLDYPYDEIFTSVAERCLNDGEDEQQFEVMNVSAPAWGTDQHYVYWKTEGFKYRPDYLVLVMAPNDMREMYNRGLVRIDSNDSTKLEVKKAWMPLEERIGWYLANKSSFFQFLQKKIFNSSYGDFFKVFRYYPVNYGKKDSTDWDLPLFLNEPFPEVEATHQLFEKILQNIHQDCKEKNVEFLLTKIPTKSEFDGSYQIEEHSPDKITNVVEQIVKENDIPFLNLNDTLRKSEDPLNIFMSWEYHFNKEGHDLMGAHLCSFIRDQLDESK